jgi:RNA polymerase-interacting CarD/CdnL/TRCF family regulator
VERIDQAAAASKRDGFTARQAEVIRDMYRKQFQKRTS